MQDLLGTCGDDCASACRAAEAHRDSGSPLVVTLVVLLLLFVSMDAIIACVAIYRAGRPSAPAATRTGAGASSGPKSGRGTTGTSQAT